LASYFSRQCELPKSLAEEQSLVAWGSIFIQAVQKDVSSSLISDDKERWQKAPWWKAKKWAFSCLSKLFSRYVSPVNVSKGIEALTARIELDMAIRL
jgi:hypothetical protein